MKKKYFPSGFESWFEFFSRSLEKIFNQSRKNFLGHNVGFQAKHKKWIRNK